MLDFEQHLIEGLSIGGKVSRKISGKSSARATPPRITARPATPKKPYGPAKGLFGSMSASIKKAQSAAKAATAALPAKAAASIPAIAAKIASPAFNVATPQVQAQVKTMLAQSPVMKQAVAAHLAMPTAIKASTAVREAVAANLAVKAMTSLANKSAPIKAAVKAAIKPTPHIAAKAVEAITPIAHACGCQAKPVLRKVKAKMACKGYPPDSVDGLLSTLHDMNTSLEKAAIQRLATYEHKQLTSKRDFEHQVLSQLQRIACKLPKCHPVRTKAHLAILRKAGK